MSLPTQRPYPPLDPTHQPPLSAGVDCAGLVRLATLGAVIGTHTGPGVVGIGFIV